MSEKTSLPVSVLSDLPPVDGEKAAKLLDEEAKALGRKIVVLDDDPTGSQTVHGVSVYTSWDEGEVLRGFEEDGDIFFILTNSRGFTAERTAKVHREIAENILKASARTGKDYIVVSRSDSTLRGHYPLETAVMRETLERGGKRFGGEVICPFFFEGGRITLNDIHYVREGEHLIPAAETEFARDKSFPYSHSHLGKWCEEKTGGAYRAGDMLYISVEELRSGDVEGIADKLLGQKDFGKIIVNAALTADMQIFAAALARATRMGGEFIVRGAAAIAKALGNVGDRGLLTREELAPEDGGAGGIVIAGSHVGKTTKQLEALRDSGIELKFIEFDQHLAIKEGGLESETARVLAIAEEEMRNGKNIVIATRRERLDLDTEDEEAQLLLSVRISDALSSVVSGLTVRPRFVIAKGGITSSDVGTRGLGVKRATVLGQLLPGVPVWKTGGESKYPGLCYVIFPGNVGSDTALLDAVRVLA